MNLEDILADEYFLDILKKEGLLTLDDLRKYFEKKSDNGENAEAIYLLYTQIMQSLAQIDYEKEELRLKERLKKELSGAVVVNITSDSEMVFLGYKKRFFVWVACISVLFISVFFFVQNHKKKISNSISSISSDEAALKTFYALNGEKKKLQLPDGTLVTLNSGSDIKIDDEYGNSNRNLILNGEAFFDVKHNKQLPFIVKCKGMSVKALGTAFNIKSYKYERLTETSLMRGSIEITLSNFNIKKVILKPKEKLIWDNEINKPVLPQKMKTNVIIKNDIEMIHPIVKNHFGSIKEIAWIENKLVFEDERLENIALLMERWYGIKTVFKSESIKKYRFTGNFEKEKMTTVLNYLKESKNFKYDIIPGDSIIIKFAE